MNRITNYIKYLLLKFIYTVTFCKNNGELKNNNKNWIYFSIFKRRYKKFVNNYSPVQNSIHEYSDYIWWCWFQGEENSPELCKKCLESIRRIYPQKKIVILSEKNIFEYAVFPEYILQKYKDGKITKAHFSDLLRLQLLLKYGGVWIDSTILATSKFDFAFNRPLFVFKNAERSDPAIQASSWFISAEKNNPILIFTRDLLFEYWKKNDSLFHYFLFHFAFTLASEKFYKEWREIPFYTNLTPHILQRELFEQYSKERIDQIKSMSSIHKLTYKYDRLKDISGTNLEKILKGEIL